MDPSATRVLGTSGVAVTQLGLGGASYGELFHRVPEQDAFAAIQAAWDGGVRYFDTAPWYGRGLSELRTGAGLRPHPRDEYVLSTKVGRWLRARPDAGFDRSPWLGGGDFEVVFDYTYDGIMRAYEQSQLRLGLPRYDVAVIHDLDDMYHGAGARLDGYFAQLATSGWRAITELRTAGLVRGVGAGINGLGLIPRFLDLVDLDFFLIAMPYTLLNQAILDDEFPACVARGIGFVIGAPYQSGILATGPRPGANADYAPPSEELNQRVGRIQAICESYGVPLAAAALQFPLGHPSVAAVIPGARSAAQVERNIEVFRTPIPADVWAELKHEGLLRSDAPVPG
ncbi:MAG: aldo/keto reductase [Chloroflexi bacterium]|nr:aldo/keto reductase [Chloroflexota bacterium]